MRTLPTLTALVLSAWALPAAAQTNIVIATGSTYYLVGVGTAKIVADAVPDLQVDAVTSGGSTENVQLIGRGEVDMAITNGVVGSLAVGGQDVFEGDAQDNLRSMFALWGNTEHQVALADTVTTGTVDDLASLGGKYNIGGRQSGARTAAELMLRALGHDLRRSR